MLVASKTEVAYTTQVQFVFCSLLGGKLREWMGLLYLISYFPLLLATDIC